MLSKRNEINESLFQSAQQLQNIVIPSSITRICKRAFDSCKSLKNILFASPSSLEFIDDFAFNNCVSLLQITIPKKVTRIGFLAFSNCKELTQVVFETPSSLKTIGNSPFNECYKLKQLININPRFTMEDLFDTVRVTINHTTSGQKFTMDLVPNKLVEDARKDILEYFSNSPVCSMSVHDGHNRVYLCDGKTLHDYGIHENSVIYVSTNRFRGGG